MNNYLNSNSLGMIREQLKGQMQSLTQQLEELNQLERQSYPPQQTNGQGITASIRSEVDRYLNELNIANNKQPNDSMAEIIKSIEHCMEKEDLGFIVGNIIFLPEYFATKEGAKSIKNLVTGFEYYFNSKTNQDKIK